MSIRTIIVDDEQLARRGLEIRLQNEDDVEIVAQCANGREALAAVREHKPELMFLDIQMPGLTGFDILKSLAGPDMPMIVFVTAYDQYAIKAFEAHAVDYLLKPIEEERLSEALDNVRKQWEQRSEVDHRVQLMNLVVELTGDDTVTMEEVLEFGLDAVGQKYLKKIPIKEGKKTTCVMTEDIDWIDAAGDYMCVHANGLTHILRGTMKMLEDGLDPRIFQRIHRSTIVNVNCVKSLRSHMNGEYFLTLKNGFEVKLSRHYKDKVKLFTQPA